MTPPPDLPFLDSPEKDALIVALIARIDALVAENTALRTRVAELEAKHGLPPKTPNNSSTPPSQGRKASDDAASKPKGKPHAGAHRPLHPNPTARRDMMATACQHCGANVSSAPQIACEAYDHIEIPQIKPDITRVTLFGGTSAHAVRKGSRPRRRKRWREARPSGRTCAHSSSICASRKATHSSVWQSFCPIFSGSTSAKARWSTCWRRSAIPSPRRQA